jgi:hypothetical protein
MHNQELLKEKTIVLAKHLINFFYQPNFENQEVTLRPLTNNNFILDFYRF